MKCIMACPSYFQEHGTFLHNSRPHYHELESQETGYPLSRPMDTWCCRVEASRNRGAGYVQVLEYHPNVCNPFPSHKNPSYASPHVEHRNTATSHSNTPGSALAPYNAPRPSSH